MKVIHVKVASWKPNRAHPTFVPHLITTRTTRSKSREKKKASAATSVTRLPSKASTEAWESRDGNAPNSKSLASAEG